MNTKRSAIKQQSEGYSLARSQNSNIPATEAIKELARGIFWVIAESEEELVANNILPIVKYCDMDGNPYDTSDCNSKSGLSYNHEQTWQELDNKIRRNKPYNYFPRGRVEIVRGKATIWLNENIEHLADDIKRLFGLAQLKEVNIKIDGSSHYKCHFDK